MVKLTKIYTRGGDTGKTSLVSGDRVLKSAPRVAAYGSVDETSATIGLVRLHTNGDVDESLSRKVSRRHAEVLRARDTQTFTLRPLPGNTGTQVGKELAQPGQNYPLTDGTPIVLGGVIWLKFETIA